MEGEAEQAKEGEETKQSENKIKWQTERKRQRKRDCTKEQIDKRKTVQCDREGGRGREGERLHCRRSSCWEEAQVHTHWIKLCMVGWDRWSAFGMCRCTEESLFLSHKRVLCVLFNSFSKCADAILTSWHLVKDRTLSFCLHLARSSVRGKGLMYDGAIS